MMQKNPNISSENSEKEVQGHHEALYDRFVERARELFDASQEKSKEAMEKAIEKAHQQLSEAGEFSAVQGEAFKKFMRRDMEEIARYMALLKQEALEHLHPARLGAGALSSMAQLLKAAGLALQSLSQKTEDALHYHTGEITSAGTLTCTGCNQKVHLKHSSRVPPCPSCYATKFLKGY
jgi:isocitrate dehydrogenase